MENSKKPLLIFDHDGTLHDSMYVFGPAMYKGVDWLKANSDVDVAELNDEWIASFLGLNSFDIWDAIVKDIPDDLCLKVASVVNDEMHKILDQGKARWFPGVDAALDALKKDGYRMVILSNCETKLAGFYWDYFHMEKWFDKFYEAESYQFIPKTEIIKIILQERGSEAVVIGDRSSDFDCAKAVNVPFVGCAYGFGTKEELAGADAIAKTPEELADVIRETSRKAWGK